MSLQPGPDRKWTNTTMFDSMDFGSYSFEEFPMAVPVVAGVLQDSPYNAKGKPHPVVIVNDVNELEALKGNKAELIPVNPGMKETAFTVVNEDDVRRGLYEQAEVRGIKIDKRWSVERIEKALSGEGDVVG